MKKQPAIEERSNPISMNTPETLRYFYHPDHIGSTSWVTDSAKNGIQYCEYLPYKKLRFFSSLAFGKTNEFVLHSLPASVGEPFLDQRSTTWNSRYTFSGKERDGETGYSYFGARYYNSDISIWLSVDPMSDKYPNLSPYAYCANNPIILVDLDGREWEIDGYCYTPGSQAPEEASQNTKDKWNTMNGIYKREKENGSTVMDEMNKEGVVYKVSSDTKGEGAGTYVSNRDGTGGTIYTHGNDNNHEILAHEMFHGYQDLKGQGGRSIHNEVEANLFTMFLGFGYSLNTIGDNRDPLYENNLAQLLTADKFDASLFEMVTNDFISCARTNKNGTYNNYPLKLDNQSKSLIKDFYPLIKPAVIVK